MLAVLGVPRHGKLREGVSRVSFIRLLIACILLLSFATACSGGAPTESVIADTPTAQITQAPSVAPTVTVTAAPTVVLDSTPAPGKGNVIGAIIRAPRGVEPYPMADTKLYLAEMLRNAQGELAGLAGVDEERAPFTWTDAKGQFVFTDIEPGHYALIIKHPITLVLAHDDPSNRDIVAEVVADQIQDLGAIQVDLTE